MATKRKLVGIWLILSFAAGIAVTSLASSQLARHTEPASRTVAPRRDLTVSEPIPIKIYII